ncbi:MAG: hypothetical protein CL912_22065 [Deltaproteobacteria bacterium]|nr:hypothetical protein [Deltaproteobacteria bacterium]
MEADLYFHLLKKLHPESMQAGYFPWASIQELCYATSCTERELTLSINKLDFGAELASTCFGWNMCGCLV